MCVLLKSVTNSLDDLRITSHKVDDVEYLIIEQDWKIKHSTVDSHLSFLSYVGMFACVVVVQTVAPKAVLNFQNGVRTILPAP